MRDGSIETVYVGYYSDGTKEYDVFKNTQINYFTPKKQGYLFLFLAFRATTQVTDSPYN